MTEQQQTPHKRRKRYSGTHPKHFDEKYKEHNPEKYQDIIQKVISKGSTPAGMHIPICVNEILEFLQIQPGQIGFDATLGYGGHSSQMLKALQGQGHLNSLDVDPVESVKTEKRLRDMGYGEEIFTVWHMNFAEIDTLVEKTGKFDFGMADLGVSSMQIDNPARGFSYKLDGPLDLRLNPEKGVSAAKRLREMDQEELMGMFMENSDEPYAKEISQKIISTFRKGQSIDTTTKLREVIEQALYKVPEKERKEAVKKSCQRCFQALRIDVNSEFEVLDAFLSKLPDIMNPGGKVAVLTFHSGEDRLVKHYFKEGKKAGLYSEISEEVIRPSTQECVKNPRARSTKMRWAIRA